MEKWAALVVKWPQEFKGINLFGALMQGFIYIETGGEPVQPSCEGGCPPCEWCHEYVTVNGDGTLDISCNCEPDADLNRDGIVNFKDVAILAHQWLTTRP